jgi:hypothetical protein
MLYLTAVSQTVFLPCILFSENLLICVKCAVIYPALYSPMLKATCCSTHTIGWDLSLAHYGGDEIPLIDTGFEMCLRLSTPLTSNFEALFSSRSRLRALGDAVVLLAGRCNVGHVYAHGSASTLVAGTQDVA